MSDDSVLVATVKELDDLYRAEQKSQSKGKKDTFTPFSSICTAIEIMRAYH
jgi:hypothetical protein